MVTWLHVLSLSRNSQNCPAALRPGQGQHLSLSWIYSLKPSPHFLCSLNLSWRQLPACFNDRCSFFRTFLWMLPLLPGISESLSCATVFIAALLLFPQLRLICSRFSVSCHLDRSASIKKLQEQNECHQVNRTRMAETMAVALEKKDQVITHTSHHIVLPSLLILTKENIFHPNTLPGPTYTSLFLCGGYNRNMADVLFLFKTKLSQRSRGAKLLKNKTSYTMVVISLRRPLIVS